MESIYHVANTAGFFAFISSLSQAQTNEASPTGLPTAEEEISIALRSQPGAIGEADFDVCEGKTVCDFEVINEAKDGIEFKIYAETKKILNTWTDHDPSNYPVD